MALRLSKKKNVSTDKVTGANPETKRTVYPVSDSHLIIRILFDSPFYGAYVDYYSFPGFYHDDTAADYLYARGINPEPDKSSEIEKILSGYSITEKDLVPDLILFLNTIFKYFELQRERISEEPFRTNKFNTLKEIVILNKLMKRYNASKPEDNIRIDFEIGDKKYIISEGFVISDIFRHLNDLSESSEYQNIFKFNYLEENEDDYFNFLKMFPGESKVEIDLVKLWTVKKAILLFADYYISKGLFGMKEAYRNYTDSAAECSGRLLGIIGFLPDEEMFENNNTLKTTYETYTTFLINTIKSYAESS